MQEDKIEKQSTNIRIENLEVIVLFKYIKEITYFFDQINLSIVKIEQDVKQDFQKI